jgi:hypothetical protein
MAGKIGATFSDRHGRQLKSTTSFQAQLSILKLLKSRLGFQMETISILSMGWDLMVFGVSLIDGARIRI